MTRWCEQYVETERPKPFLKIKNIGTNIARNRWPFHVASILTLQQQRSLISHSPY